MHKYLEKHQWRISETENAYGMTRVMQKLTRSVHSREDKAMSYSIKPSKNKTRLYLSMQAAWQFDVSMEKQRTQEGRLCTRIAYNHSRTKTTYSNEIKRVRRCYSNGKRQGFYNGMEQCRGRRCTVCRSAVTYCKCKASRSAREGLS